MAAHRTQVRVVVQMLPRAESVEHAATALCLYLYLHLSLSRAQRERAERFIPPVLN